VPLARLVRVDLRLGWRQASVRLVVLFVVANVMCFMLFSLVATGHTQVERLSFADFVAACLGGAEDFSLSGEGTFRLPVGWMCTCMLMAYVPLGYPVRDLEGYGALLLVGTGGRARWWVSKLIWTVLTSLVCWVTVMAVCALWACLTGGGLGEGCLLLTRGVPELLGFHAPRAALGQADIRAVLLAGPASLMALCSIQLVVSLALAPVAGFAVAAAILVLSALYATPALPGFSLMVARFVETDLAGGTVTGSLLASAATLAVMVLAGALVSARRDIRGREADAS
jgi:hypothetical protein